MIERALRFAYAHRRAVLAAAGVVLAASVILATRVTFDANILRLLPRTGPAVRGFDTYLQHFGTFDQVYVLFDAPPGGQIADTEAFINEYVERLRKAPEIASVDAELFDDVKDWTYLFDRALLLLGADEAARALGRFTPAGLSAALVETRELLRVSSPGVKEYVRQDPLGLLGALRDRLGRGRELVEFDPAATGYVTRDGRSRLVMARPVRPPFDTRFCTQLFARLDAIERATRAATAESGDAASPSGSAPVTVRVAGGYRIALDAERVIRRELIVNSTASLIILLLLVLVVFRTAWILLYSIVPLSLAALLTLGVNGLAGPLSPATSGNSAMLFGLGFDGIALIYLRYMEERGRGFGAEGAVARTSGTAGSVILAYCTTAATFLALVLVDFPTLQDLGKLVGLGILACVVLLVFLLPALIGVTSPRAEGRQVASPWLGRIVERHGRALLAGAVAVTLALGWSATRLRLNTSLERLQVHTGGATVEEDVAARFGLARDVLIAIGEGPEVEPLLASGRQLAAAVARNMPSITVSSPDTVLPTSSDQEAVASAVRRARLDPAAVAANIEREAAAAGFRPGAFQPFLTRVPRLLDPAERLTYQGLVEHGLAPLVSRYLAAVPGGFVAAVYFYPRGPADLGPLDTLVTAAPPYRLTGVPVVNRELAERFLPQFLRGVIIGVLAVGLFMYAVFRNVGNALLAFLSTTLGGTWAAGLLALAGVEIDLFSMFAAITFIGIATDYDIYVIYRYRVEGTRPMREVLTRAGPAILVAGATTIIGFGSLVNSSYGPLRSFGITSVTMVACSLVVSMLVLPALLQEVQR